MPVPAPTHRLVDLSVALRPGIASDPPGATPDITYVGHAEGAAQMVALFPGLAPADLPDGLGWAVEQVRLSTHNGTHMDAPWHYAPTMDGGREALRIDQIPLEWCYAPGVKLDFRHLPDGHVVGAAEIDAELARIGHTLRPRDIVLVNTAAGERYGQDDYLARGCGMGREATLRLTRQGIRVVGTDAWSWDAPFVHTARRFAASRDAAIIWEGHYAGRDAGYCQLEKLHALETLPATGFEVICFPVKIAHASAGWARVVAVLPG